MQNQKSFILNFWINIFYLKLINKKYFSKSTLLLPVQVKLKQARFIWSSGDAQSKSICKIANHMTGQLK